jgi:hypothetical protein
VTTNVTASRRGLAVGALTLVLAVGGALAGACRGGDPGSADQSQSAPAMSPSARRPASRAPSGYIQVTAGNISFAHPRQWRAATPPNGWTLAVELRGPGYAAARAGVISDIPQVRDVTVAATAAFAGVQANAVRVRRSPDKKLTVLGAAAALRVDYVYENAVAGRPTGDLARGTDISVVFGGHKAATVRIAGLRDQLAPETIDQIVRTISVTS